MQILILIVLPWIIYGLLTLLGLWPVYVNIGIAFVVEILYIIILFDLYMAFYGEKTITETVLERARKIRG